MSLLEVKELTKSYGSKVVVNHINLSVETGQLVAFLGPNGAGKSTTLNMLTGLLKPKMGSISLDGLKPTQAKYRNQIGVVFQNSVLDDSLTVKQNLRLRAKMYHHIDTAFVTKLMQAFEIESIADQKYGTLSGGQRRRVDITRALMHRPNLLFLDEPSTGLDIQTRNKIWAVLNQLRKDFQLTVILTTHYLEEAEHADYVYVIDHGEIIASDTVANLKKRYAKDVLTITTDQMAALKQLVKSDWPATIENQQISITMPDVDTTIQFLSAARALINTMEYQRGSMDDIFVELTGKGIR